MTEVKTHSEYSPSSATRWRNCPGSINLIRKAPPAIESAAAASGTRTHWYLEQFLKSKRPRSQRIFYEKSFPGEVDKIERAYDAFALIEKMAERLDLAGKWEAEIQVNTSPILGIAFQSGTLDCAIAEPFGTLIIIDYKDGVGPVDPKDNDQLILYALAYARARDYEFENVQLVIIQPKVNPAPLVWTISMAELRERAAIYRAAAQLTRQPDAIRAPGDWCRFCPAAVICPEISTKRLKDAQIDFNVEGKALTVPADKPPVANLANLLWGADHIEKWIDAVRAHAFHYMNNGGKLDGFKLVDKQARRKWRDEKEVAARALKVFGKKVFSEPELLSPAQFEKAVGRREWIDRHTVAESSGLTMVSDQDPRPARNANMKNDFEILEHKPLKGEKNGSNKKTSKTNGRKR